MRPPQGFGSEEVAATVILASSHVGFPLSTTQVVSGAVDRLGRRPPGRAVNWSVAGRIVIGWVLTLPAAAASRGVAYAVIDLFGDDSAVGPIVVGIILAIGCVPALPRQPPPGRRAGGDRVRAPDVRARLPAAPEAVAA